MANATVISENMKFQGEVNFENELIIQGDFQGVVESNGKLTLKSTSNVKADIKVKDILLEGKMQGNIIKSESVHITNSANITGDIHSKSIQIDKGGILNGTTFMK